MSAFLEIENIKVTYDKKPVIINLSLKISPGTFVGLVGPNGAGKTTLLLSASGQFKPHTGTIQYKGRDIYQNNYDYKKVISFVHENPFFYSHLTVGEFLVFVARVKGVPQQNLATHIDSLLNNVRLSEERGTLTSQLSHGMRKKLAIAAALVNSPHIIFLDEALNGLDMESAYYIKKLLNDFVKAGGTIILSTHTWEVIEKICNRIIVLKSGQIIADLNAQESAKMAIDFEKHILALLAS